VRGIRLRPRARVAGWQTRPFGEGPRIIPEGTRAEPRRPLGHRAACRADVPQRQARRAGSAARAAVRQRRPAARPVVVLLRRRLALLVSAHRARPGDAQARRGGGRRRIVMRAGVAIAALLCAWPGAAGSEDRASTPRTWRPGLQTGQEQPVFRSGVDGVTIQGSVRRGNQPVAGLTAADFLLEDNGVGQNISTLSVEKLPLDLTLLLDLSASVDGQMLQRLTAAVRDTAALLHDDDRIRLVTISQ